MRPSPAETTAQQTKLNLITGVLTTALVMLLARWQFNHGHFVYQTNKMLRLAEYRSDG
jgi:hypothetical protein